MSVDLWDLSERATRIVKKQIKEDINEEEMTGIFYQEFCEPSEIEKQYETKVNWMLENGFKDCQDYGFRYITPYNSYTWNENQIKFHSLNVIKKCKEWYDGIITEQELDEYLEKQSK